MISCSLPPLPMTAFTPLAMSSESVTVRAAPLLTDTASLSSLPMTSSPLVRRQVSSEITSPGAPSAKKVSSLVVLIVRPGMLLCTAGASSAHRLS